MIVISNIPTLVFGLHRYALWAEDGARQCRGDRPRTSI